MQKALLIGQVATLARDIEKTDFDFGDIGLHVDQFNDDENPAKSMRNLRSPEAFGSLLDGVDFSSRRSRINELLGDWEEPEDQRAFEEKANIAAIIQFRQSVTYLNSHFPFSMAFGDATNRQDCVQCSEAVYNSLLLSMKGATVLKFDVISLLAIRKNGELDEDKLKSLIRLFRPDREGYLTLMDFAKSIDTVYKELRLLRASVASSSRVSKLL